MAGKYRILKKVFKWLASLIIGLLAILLIIQILIIVHFDKIVEDAIKETVKSSTNDLYTIEFKNLSINVFTGSVRGQNIRLTPDTVVYKRLKEMGTAPTLLFKISVPELRITRINVYSAYFDKHLQVHKIIIKSPSVDLLNEPENHKEKKRKKDPLDLYPLLSSVLKKAEASAIEIEDGSFRFKKIKNKQVRKNQLSKLSITFEKVLIDSTAFSDTTNFFYSDEIRADVVDYTLTLPGNFYKFKIGKSSLSTKNASIKLQNLVLTPLHSKFKFGKIYGSQVDMLKVKVKEIQFTKIDLREFLDKQTLMMDEVLIDETDIVAFRDKRIPYGSKKVPKMPQELLKELENRLIIGKVRVRDLNVTYEEMPEAGGTPGVVTFKNIFVRITDINNDPIAIEKGQTVWMSAQGYLMGKGLIKAKFKFPLNSSNGTYFYSGSLEDMRFKDMNTIIKPLASVEITGGVIKKMEFNVTANNDKATGKMMLYYNNLKVQLKSKDGQVGLKEKFGSFIANNFFVESDNPTNGVFREGKIEFERDKNKFVFNYWWKTLLSGIKPSIGIDANKQQSIKQFASKMEERKKKRAARKKERRRKNLAKKQD